MNQGLTSYRHTALLYQGTLGFLRSALPFIRQGLQGEEPVLVMVEVEKINLVRRALRKDRCRVEFEDMNEVGSNPARIIPAWQDFVDRSGGDRPVRGIGEPVSAAMCAAKVVEGQLHESLLNLAFADSTPLNLLCPYDTIALDGEVIAEAQRSHRRVRESDQERDSKWFRGLDVPQFQSRLPAPPTEVHELSFDLLTLPVVREFVTAEAREAKLELTSVEDVALAAHEVATNSILYGGGRGTVRAWREEEHLVLEVTDAGAWREPLAGRRRPGTDSASGRGLWLVNQLCDLVQVRSLADGTVVRLHKKAA